MLLPSLMDRCSADAPLLLLLPSAQGIRAHSAEEDTPLPCIILHSEARATPCGAVTHLLEVEILNAVGDPTQRHTALLYRMREILRSLTGQEIDGQQGLALHEESCTPWTDALRGHTGYKSRWHLTLG